MLKDFRVNPKLSQEDQEYLSRPISRYGLMQVSPRRYVVIHLMGCRGRTVWQENQVLGYVRSPLFKVISRRPLPHALAWEELNTLQREEYLRHLNSNVAD